MILFYNSNSYLFQKNKKLIFPGLAKGHEPGIYKQSKNFIKTNKIRSIS